MSEIKLPSGYVMTDEDFEYVADKFIDGIVADLMRTFLSAQSRSVKQASDALLKMGSMYKSYGSQVVAGMYLEAGTAIQLMQQTLDQVGIRPQDLDGIDLNNPPKHLVDKLLQVGRMVKDQLDGRRDIKVQVEVTPVSEVVPAKKPN